MTRKIFYSPLCIFLCPFVMQAQVTTGSVTGTVKSPDGKALEGATITLIHTPSGSKYITLSRKQGAFALVGLRIGGPYTLMVNFVGFKAQTREGFNISLGEPYDFSISMNDVDTRGLEGVVVRSKKRTAAAEKSGASTVIDSRMLATLPSYSRSITDFTRLTPQSSGGNSFAGRLMPYR